MRELKQNEIENVSGAGFLHELVDDIYYTIQKLPTIYDAAITSTTDMMCRATSNC
jgi:hypothetical protein